MRTEQLILENLIFSDEYASLIGVFLKPEYFKAYPEKIVFTEIQNHILEYNKPPTLPALENMITSRDDLNEATFKNCMEVLTTYKTKTDDHEWLVHETEKWAKDQAVYNGIVDSIAILEGKDTKKPKDAIPDILTDALAVSLDTSVGHNYIEDAEDRWDYYHKREQKFPFNIEMLDKITGGGITPKTLTVFLGGTGVEKEALFQKTRHRGLPFGRLKYLFYCFLLMVDGLIGIMSFGQTQSIMAQKYLLSIWMIDEEGCL